MYKEYSTIREVTGALMLVEGVRGAVCGELVEVVQPGGHVQLGQVLEVDTGGALVQLSEANWGVSAADRARFTGRGMELNASVDMLGRMFNGLGAPRDGGPEVIPDVRMDMNGAPINPMARECPGDMLITGISAIDGINPVARGQKLAVLSRAGLTHVHLAMQMAKWAHTEGAGGFAVVLGAVGLSFDEVDMLRRGLELSGALGRTAMFVSMAGEPLIERLGVPRAAMSAAEYLAWEQGMDVLVILIDMAGYAEALREAAAMRRWTPCRRGYPANMRADLASIYERAGRLRGQSGSITLLPFVTVPGGDMSHPITDINCSITEGQIVLSRELYARGIEPPIDVLASISRTRERMMDGQGARAVHRLCAAYARGRSAWDMATVLGDAAPECEYDLYGEYGEDGEYGKDRRYWAMAQEFERRYVAQGESERTLEETHELRCELLERCIEQGEDEAQ